jgi:hypothetical protein
MNQDIPAMCAEIAEHCTIELIEQLNTKYPDRHWLNVYTRCKEIASGEEVDGSDKKKIQMIRRIWASSTGKDYFS